MKNQYFGNIGDYGKYALLRFMSEQGVSVAVNWYLTADDGDDDKKQTSYLEDVKYWKYDPDLYRHLRESVIVKNERSISVIGENDLIPDAKIFDDQLEDPRDYSKSERSEVRKKWHMKGLDKLAGTDMVFLDPDSGFRDSLPKKIDDAVKYCYSGEVSDYYKSGSDICFYTQRGRRSDAQWQEAKKHMKDALPGAVMMGLTFRDGGSFIFAIHPQRADRMKDHLDAFLHTDWRDMFSEEPV
ncbi:MAG: hypothetical protein K6B14_04805 [Lachnospiraceae bacterium]|nr:hypothetical protein [Lachnospiraceae bacterium]